MRDFFFGGLFVALLGFLTYPALAQEALHEPVLELSVQKTSSDHKIQAFLASSTDPIVLSATTLARDKENTKAITDRLDKIIMILNRQGK